MFVRTMCIPTIKYTHQQGIRRGQDGKRDPARRITPEKSASHLPTSGWCVIQQRSGRHIGDLAAKGGAMYLRMCSGPSWSGERWKYCANYTPMLSEHGCERLSGTSWENAEQCAQGSAVADSLAQAAACFRKVKPNRVRGAVSATAPKLV
jgi:hypothetical protein